VSLSSHQSRRPTNDRWLTPPGILRVLGDFDLDPCCPPVMPWRTAARMIAPPADGLAEPWAGRVWLNPPFGNCAAAWMEKLAGHGLGVAMIPARTETRMFFSFVWSKADAVLFLRGRPHFYRPDGSRAPGNSGAPMALVAYGEENARVLAACGLGVCVRWARESLT